MCAKFQISSYSGSGQTIFALGIGTRFWPIRKPLETKISTFLNFSDGFSPKYISVPNFKFLAIVEVPNTFDESASQQGSKSASQSVLKSATFSIFNV